MSALSSPPALLVGREREFATLHDQLERAIAGHGSLVLIGGEAGVGKTALAEMLCREAADGGALVLVGRCYDLTETPPYGLWVELFKQYASADDLPPLPPAFAQRGTVGAVTSQSALLQQVKDFFHEVTRRRSLALLLDDLHWADPASLDLLRFLARSVASLPMLVLGTYRSDELTRHDPLSQLLPMLVREAHAERLDLHALDDAAVRSLVTARYRLMGADTDRLMTYLQARGEGNALFVGELLRSLAEGGVLTWDGEGWRLGNLAQATVPALLRQVIDARFSRLDKERQRLFAVAAVIGHEVALDVWATMTECDEATVLDTVEQGLDARLLVEVRDDDRVRFAHALIREALYEQLPRARRRRIHRRAGEVFAALPNADPDVVAYHYQRADDERALPWLLEAGERAQAAYAWMTATARFEAALALMERMHAGAGERGWLLLRSSRLLRWVDVAKARTFADEAVALAQAANDGALAAFARYHRGLSACVAGDVAGGLSEMEAGADALSALSDAERADYAAHAGDIGAARIPDGRGAVVMWRANVGRFHAARELGERLVAEVEAGSEGAEPGATDGYFGLGDAYAALGMPDEASAMHARAHDAYLRTDHHILASHASWREIEWVALPYRTEDLAERRRLADRAEREHARASGAIPAIIPPRFVRSALLVLEGEWEEAERLAVAVSAEARGNVFYRMTALRYLATLAWLRGDSERAWSAVRAWLPAGSATEPGTVDSFDFATALQRVAVALALDAGDLATAKAWLDAHDRWLAVCGAVLGQSEGHGLWAQYYRQAGDARHAYERAQRALACASKPRQPLALLAAHRLLGELETVAGQLDDALAQLNTSLALADTCAAPYERALTLLALAELHGTTGDRAAASALLDAVHAIGTPLSARLILAKANALAARLAAVPEASPMYPAGLSAREVEVLRLIAAGLSNRDIAATLFLSERTVHAHVRHILTKTEADNRAAATAFALRHGLA